MDDLLREFVTETNESLDVVDVELVRFEQDPNNAKILANVFRLVHTIKGTCGFLGLPRLEALAHAAETLMGKFRDGLPATNDAVTLILTTIDRIKQILESLEREQREPDGADDDLISDLDEINAEFETTDVALIIGANDVVNPDARSNKSSPIYGMPILNADKAKNVIVIKRGQGQGFSGIDNALFVLDQTRMLYGDAQAAVSQLITAVKAAG